MKLLAPHRFPSLLVFSGLAFALSSLAPLSAATIVLDAGHGGEDSGTVPKNRLAEKHATLDVAKRVQALLQSSGHRVLMTRSADVFVPLENRVDLSNRSRGKVVFVSLHFNSASTRTSRGIETYCYSRQSAKLAEKIHRHVLKSSKTLNRGVRHASFYVLRFNHHPAVLVELGFLTHPKEGAQISRSKRYRQHLAEGLANGIRSSLP